MSARIMVVEDEEALTTLLRYNLDAEGYDVETVGRGDDADTRLKERVPDLVVLDWMLPGLSGVAPGRPVPARRRPPPGPAFWARRGPRRVRLLRVRGGGAPPGGAPRAAPGPPGGGPSSIPD